MPPIILYIHAALFQLPIYEPAIESRVVHTTSSPSQIGKYKEAIQGYVTATRQSSQVLYVLKDF